MTKTQPIQTGPLTPADVGQFVYRDGVWYLSPSPLTVKRPTVN